MKTGSRSRVFRWSSPPNKVHKLRRLMLCLVRLKGLGKEDHTLKSWKRIAIGLICLLGLIGVAACSGQPLSTREKGTLGGVGLGAATGAIIGAAVGSPGAGAAIGGALGGVGGAVIGDQMQGQEVRQTEQQRQMEEQNREIQQQRRELEQLKHKSRR